jgi:periplasmic mercuric ion binding protein
MKSIILFVVVLVTAMCSLTVSAQAQIAEVDILTSSQCQMCKDRLEEKMLFTKGVKKVELDLEANVLHIWYNPSKVDLPQLRKAVNAIGYDADGQLADQAAHDALPMCCQKTAGKH